MSLDSKPQHAHRICAAETPEGHACGCVRHMALFADVAHGITDTAVLLRALVSEAGVNTGLLDGPQGLDHPQAVGPGVTWVMLNGVVVGTTRAPTHVIKMIDEWRASRRFPAELGCVHTRAEKLDELRILTDAGRVLAYYLMLDPDSGLPLISRPVLRELEEGRMTFQDLVDKRFVQPLCSQSASRLNVAFDIRDAYADARMPDPSARVHNRFCAIHPAGIFGISALVNVPRAHHDNALRTMFQSSMAKAAAGVVGPVERWGVEAQTLQLAYPQIALNQTAVADAIHLGQDVQNVLLAVVCSPSTLEDSYLMCSTAVERGLFQRYADRYYKATSTPVDATQTSVGSFDVIALPPQDMLQQYRDKYKHLDADGICRVGERVDPGTILISVQRITNNKSRDASIVQRCGEHGVVTQVVVAEGSKPGSKCVTVVVRSWLKITVGDKISTHGQKGTVGEMRHCTDMIFDPITGMVPSVVINPHSFRRNTQAFVPSMLHADSVLRTGKNDPDLCDAFVESAMGVPRDFVLFFSYQRSTTASSPEDRRGPISARPWWTGEREKC